MADGIVFRTVDLGRWGAAGGSGTGGHLTPVQVDENFWELLSRLESIESDPPEAVSILGFTVIGSQFQVNMSDASTFGPFDLPIAQFRWQGEWVNDGIYLKLDIISANHFGVFIVEKDHTAPSSPAPFDPAALDPITFEPLYKQVFGEDTSIYDIGFFFPGRPGIGIEDASAIAGHVFVHPITFPQDLPGSEAFLKTGGAADMSFAVQKNGTDIGTIDFGAGDNVATFTFAADVDFAIGDRVTVMKPTDGVDADARELSITIKGSRIF
jgi:hypothetical protein